MAKLSNDVLDFVIDQGGPRNLTVENVLEFHAGIVNCHLEFNSYEKNSKAIPLKKEMGVLWCVINPNMLPWLQVEVKISSFNLLTCQEVKFRRGTQLFSGFILILHIYYYILLILFFVVN